MPLLEATGLCVSYGSLPAVRDVSFSVAPGEIVALVGSNGAGKSTILKALIGLVAVARGRILWQGVEIQHATAAARVAHGLALSPEGRRLFGRMTVRDNLLVGAHSVRSRAAVQHTLASVFALFPRLAERQRQLAASLSGGEQQMVAVGRALMAQPKVLMLDEPSLGIAPKIIAEIAAAIRRLNRESGVAIVLVEQNARLALGLCHHGYALEHGQVVRAGNGADLLADPFVRKAYLGV